MGNCTTGSENAREFFYCCSLRSKDELIPLDTPRSRCETPRRSRCETPRSSRSLRAITLADSKVADCDSLPLVVSALGEGKACTQSQSLTQLFIADGDSCNAAPNSSSWDGWERSSARCGSPSAAVQGPATAVTEDIHTYELRSRIRTALDEAIRCERFSAGMGHCAAATEVKDADCFAQQEDAQSKAGVEHRNAAQERMLAMDTPIGFEVAKPGGPQRVVDLCQLQPLVAEQLESQDKSCQQVELESERRVKEEKEEAEKSRLQLEAEARQKASEVAQGQQEAQQKREEEEDVLVVTETPREQEDARLKILLEARQQAKAEEEHELRVAVEKEAQRKAEEEEEEEEEKETARLQAEAEARQTSEKAPSPAEVEAQQKVKEEKKVWHQRLTVRSDTSEAHDSDYGLSDRQLAEAEIQAPDGGYSRGCNREVTAETAAEVGASGGQAMAAPPQKLGEGVCPEPTAKAGTVVAEVAADSRQEAAAAEATARYPQERVEDVRPGATAEAGTCAAESMVASPQEPVEAEVETESATNAAVAAAGSSQEPVEAFRPGPTVEAGTYAVESGAVSPQEPAEAVLEIADVPVEKPVEVHQDIPLALPVGDTPGVLSDDEEVPVAKIVDVVTPVALPAGAAAKLAQGTADLAEILREPIQAVAEAPAEAAAAPSASISRGAVGTSTREPGARFRQYQEACRAKSQLGSPAPESKIAPSKRTLRNWPMRKLGNIKAQRVVNAGIARLHEELTSQTGVDIGQLPKWEDGRPKLLGNRMLSRLLNSEVEFKACSENDAASAQSDLRHLRTEQLTFIRSKTLDFSTESASHTARNSFLETVDKHLFEKLTRQCLQGTSTFLPADPDVLHSLGLRLVLVRGVVELLGDGVGDGWDKAAGDDGRILPPLPSCWALWLEEAEWPGCCQVALFNVDELWLRPLRGDRLDFAETACGQPVAIVRDQSSGTGKDCMFHWEIAEVDPNVADVLEEMEKFQSKSARKPKANGMELSAVLAKRIAREESE